MKAINDKVIQYAKNNIALRPNEKAVLKAYWRQGLQELRNSFYQDSRIATDVDYGIWGKATPGEVGQERAQEPRNLLEQEQDKLRQQLEQEPRRDKEMEK
ncbi:MAG: hypothetical protein U0796_02785 [Gemmatales bacterium]